MDKIAYCAWDRGEPGLLEKLRDGYETLSPVRKRLLKSGGRSIVDAVALTPGYVFFYTDDPITELGSIKKVNKYSGYALMEYSFMRESRIYPLFFELVAA